MLERHADAIIGGALVLMALALIRPSSGMRMIALGLLLAATAVVGMGLGLRNLLSADRNKLIRFLSDLPASERLDNPRRNRLRVARFGANP
jgi:hypothetical protein